LVALYIGAIPIVDEEECFRDAGEESGILKAARSVDSWRAAIAKAQDAKFRALMLSRLRSYCARRFSSDGCWNCLNGILEARPAMDILGWTRRAREIALSMPDRSRMEQIMLMEEELNSRTYRLSLHIRGLSRRTRSLLGRLRQVPKIVRRG